MQTALNKDSGKKKRRRLPAWAIISVAALILALAAFLTIGQLRAKKLAQTVQQQRTSAVTKGSLSVSLSGSGSLTPAVREEISSSVGGDVLKVNCETGQKVYEGQILIEIDRTDAELNYQKLVNALEREKLTFKDLEKKIDSLEIKVPFSGWTTGVSVKEGDTLKENTPVMTLTNKSELELTVPFSPSDIESLKKGDPTTVNVQDLMQQIQGRVSYIGPDTYVTSDGIMARDVTVNIQNPGLLAEGMRAGIWLENSDAASLDMGTLEYIESTVVKSDASGDVAKVNVLENCYVKEGEVLVVLENSDLVLSRDNASLSLKEMELQVEQAQNQLEDYSITSPVNGTIVNMKRINKGDSIKAGIVLMEIVNTDIMEFDVAVDELDITKVETGQEVRVTVDAIEETLTAPLSGTVSNIAIESKSINGVTTYPVTITLDGTEKLLGGMNANAEILVQNKLDALLVPIEAVTVIGGVSYVWVKGERPEQQSPATQENASGIQRRKSGIQLSEEQKNNLKDALEESGGDRQALREKFQEMRQKQQARFVQADSYYEGAYRKIVKTGAHNETHMEIISGLNEGDMVVLPPLASDENSSSSQEEGQRSPFGIPGGGFRR